MLNLRVVNLFEKDKYYNKLMKRNNSQVHKSHSNTVNEMLTYLIRFVLPPKLQKIDLVYIFFQKEILFVMM